ncbi:MAG: hypothetical protein J0M10_09660 [Chitinophagales bacterium]|nr:hypothetical protein [Chitinophagales bacterium]
MAKNSLSTGMRVIHRYLGFFLAGIMAVYSLSGIVLIFRDTDFLKKEKQVVKELKPNLEAKELGQETRIKELKVTKTEGDLVYFNNGSYNKATGHTEYKVKELPFVISKLTGLHKAKSSEPLFFLNVFFGVSLFFFVISSFWMFMPKTSIFKKGMIYTIAGIILTLILLFV